MTHLSVNLNRIALLRNSRDIGIPDVLHFARLAIAAGAYGITIHPRPDQRHIRVADVTALTALLKLTPEIEFNIEGNPFTAGPAAFMPLIEAARPHQATLVPDTDAQATSDHGWNLPADGARLAPVIAQLKAWGCRVSLFMDADAAAMTMVRDVGADRVELYTKPYVDSRLCGDHETADQTLTRYVTAAEAAHHAGLGVNAGHDLNLTNLSDLVRAIPWMAEVSIGHALTADALEMGFVEAVRAYVAALRVEASPAAGFGHAPAL
jgi:pyridoxine 5-phosphate synthase